MSPPARIYLIGFMGVGKSTVGALLAAKLGLPHLDLDEAIERSAGCSIQQIFERDGEPSFREIESNALRETQNREKLVISCGGGIFDSAANRGWIAAHGESVWLDAPLNELRRRVNDGESRPRWICADSLRLRELYERRRPSYALATCRVDASGSPTQITAELFERFGGFFVD